MDNYMIGVLVLLVCVLIARILNDRANKKLDQSKKAELIDLFSKSSAYHFGILIAILSLFYLNIKMNCIGPTLALTIYTIFFVLFFIGISYLYHKKLKDNNFPESYIRLYLLSICIRFLGIAAFFTIFMAV